MTDNNNITVQSLLEKKIENPTELLAKINQDYSYITKEYVLSADLNQIKELQTVKEILNNSRDGLIAKIDMFIDLVNAEVNPVLEPLKMAKKQLQNYLLNIKETDLIEKRLIIDNNYKDCFELIIEEIPDCGLTLTKMKVLDYFYDLEKKAKTVDVANIAKSFIKKYTDEIVVINQQAPAYIEDYKKGYDLQKVLLKKMEVEAIKQKEVEIVKPIEAIKSIEIIEPVSKYNEIIEPVETSNIRRATIEIIYTEEQAKFLNDFIEVMERNNIEFNIIK